MRASRMDGREFFVKVIQAVTDLSREIRLRERGAVAEEIASRVSDRMMLWIASVRRPGRVRWNRCAGRPFVWRTERLVKDERLTEAGEGRLP